MNFFIKNWQKEDMSKKVQTIKQCKAQGSALISSEELVG
jgi:hypothetical protein